jgi:acetyl esterase
MHLAHNNEAWIDPEMRTILEQIAAAPKAPDPWTIPIDEARRLAHQTMLAWNAPKVELAEIGDEAIPGPAGKIAVRWYRPSKGGALPTILFFHGGGWTFGSIKTHESTASLLAQASGALVASVEYRLAPEHAHPAAYEDARAAWAWLSGQGGRLGLNGKIVVSGDSAGANIALGLCVGLRDARQPQPCGAALFYGCFAPIFDTESHRRNGGGEFVLTSERMRWFWGNYLGQASPFDPIGAPLHADLAGLPPMHLTAAELDCLADDTWLLAKRLAEARVPHEVRAYRGVIHGFLQMSRQLSSAREAIDAAGRWVRATTA